MKEFSELIKNIDMLRRLIREFFVFGYKTRTDFDRKSSKTFDNDKRRIQNYFEEYFYGARDKNGKRNAILIDSDRVDANPLYRLYKSKSFTANDLILHFLIVDAFQDLESASTMEFADYMATEYKVDDIDIGTVRLKLNEYVDLGILKSDRQNKTLYYSLNDSHIQDKLEFDGISFFSEVAPLGVIGSFICDRFSEQTAPVIRFKHRLLYSALDSYYLLRMFEAIENKEVLKVTKRLDGVDETIIVLPLKILINHQNGREYAACFDTQAKQYTNCRLDQIVTVETTTDGYDEESFNSLVADVNERLKHTWNVNFYQNRFPLRVELIVYIGDDEEFILNRLQREGHNGNIAILENNRYRYSNAVYDPSEMIPWLKSFIGRIVSVWIEDEKWNNQLHKDILRLLGDE